MFSALDSKRLCNNSSWNTIRITEILLVTNQDARMALRNVRFFRLA